MRANIVRKQHNNFGCDAVSHDEACEISGGGGGENDVLLHAYFSTLKPELSLILQVNDSILV